MSQVPSAVSPAIFLIGRDLAERLGQRRCIPDIAAGVFDHLYIRATYWGSENDWNQFMSAGDFAVATYWSGSAARSIGKGLPVAFVVPDEGAIGWLEGLSVPTAPTKQGAAYSFITWMIDPAFYSKWDAEGAPATSNAKAAAALPDTSFNKSVLGDPADVARGQFMRPVSDEARATYLALRQELKAAQ